MTDAPEVLKERVRHALAREGHAQVRQRHNASTMAEATLAVFQLFVPELAASRSHGSMPSQAGGGRS